MIEISQINQSLSQNAVIVVFANVLLQQLGLPLPAVPTLLLAGSLVTAPSNLGMLLAAAVVASVIADWIWYGAGRAFGYRVLAGLCKLSINPASCVSTTEARFLRWGVSSLVIAKFIPGFSTVAPPIAGALRMKLPGFLLAAAAGASLWAGLALATGWLMRDAVQTAMQILEQRLGQATPVVLLVIGVWISWKLWQKYRFKKFSSIPHITIDELIQAMEGEARPLLLDLRGATMIAAAGPIPGAVVAEHDFLNDAVGNWPKHQPIVTLCACPEDAGAIQAARHLLKACYQSVRPLAGGYDAWLAAEKK